MTFDIMDLTDGWLTDWDQGGGRFKEWVRGMHLTAINHGWFYTLYMQPVWWWGNLCHAVSWIPLLWDDRDCDHIYLWKMMREKLKRMHQHHAECSMHANHEKLEFEMRIAIELLNRIIADDYMMADLEEHNAKFEPQRKHFREERPDGMIATWTETSDEDRADSNRIYKKAMEARQRDLDFLGQILAKDAEKWWC